MRVQIFNFSNNKWSVKKFPPLDSDRTLVLIFASSVLCQDINLIPSLKMAYPKSKIIGCSTAGEILNNEVFDESISVAVIQFESTNIAITKSPIHKVEDSFEAGISIAKTLNAEDLRGIFVLSDGLNINGTELTKGINSAKKHNVIVTGGLAGDGDRFKQTWAIFDGKVEKNIVVAVGFYGDRVHIGHGSKGGWDIFGPERRITRSNKNILYELDNKPALLLYKEYLGELAKGLPATGLLFPLAIREGNNDERHLVRTILGIDEKEQALIFAGEMPMGYYAQLMRANFDRIIMGASGAGVLACSNLKPSLEAPLLAIAISCVGRKLLLGTRIEEEVESTLNVLPKNTQQIGFYSYGELSPYTEGNCDLHNQTMTLTTIYEA